MDPLMFDIPVEMSLFLAVQAADLGKVEFPRSKVEIMRILRENITSSLESLDYPPGPQRQLAFSLLMASDAMFQTRVNIGTRLVLEFMETPHGLRTILAPMVADSRSIFLENLNLEIIMTTQMLVLFVMKSTSDQDLVARCKKIQEISTRLSSNHPHRYAGLLGIVRKEKIDREAVQREYIAELDKLVRPAADTQLSDENYAIIAGRLGAYSVWKIMSPDCPVLGEDICRPRNMADALAYPEDNLGPIDSDRRMTVVHLLRRCIKNLEADLERRAWYAANAEMLD